MGYERYKRNFNSLSSNQAFGEYIYGRREKERGKEKQDLSKIDKERMDSNMDTQPGR